LALSDFDLRLLAELQANGRISKRDLAKTLGVSSVTVSIHMSKLEKEGVIQGYSVLLDPESFGYTIEAAIEVAVEGGRIVEVENQLSKSPNVYAVYDVTGETDVLLLARFKSRHELSQFVKTILRNRYVVRTNTRLVLTVIKRTNSLPVLTRPSSKSELSAVRERHGS
jgi:DNA-binding Lrp family transcriptional regulator